jgi:Flp pilus assembly protein TadG
MRFEFGSKRHRDAQSFVFFMLAWGTIMLLAGLAIDSGLLYLAKARMSRAVDGAALAAVGNFNREPVPADNRDAVAVIMRNFAVANFTSLSPISTTGSATAGGVPSSYSLPNGTTATRYTYNFNDGTQDSAAKGGNYRRYVEVVLNTGSGGAITSATCNARCPVQTFFIGYATYAINGRQNVKIGGYSGPSGLVDLKVSSSAVATRNPRLIMVVIDRSASMLQTPGGGASGLPPAVVQFLDFFDTSSDNIGIVSFGSSARLEMPMTTNFIYAGTNNLTDAYETNASGGTDPGVDPELVATNGLYDPNYNTTGVRRLKFGGDTAADDGIRLAMEQLMANAGFNDPDVVKYMVIFTDGAWNASRTMVAAPGYTNTVTVPTFSIAEQATNTFVVNAMASIMTNGEEFHGAGTPSTNYGPWISDVTTNSSVSLSKGAGVNSNLMLMPSLSPFPDVTNAIDDVGTNSDFAVLVPHHDNDTWLSADQTAYEPLTTSGTILGGTVIPPVTNSFLGTDPFNGKTNYYTHNFDVWLQPGAVAYYYTNGVATTNGLYVAYVSDYTHPTKHINLYVNSGGKVDLVVPGYIADGVVYDGLDLNYPDNVAYGTSGYPHFRNDNYQQQWMWPDDQGGTDATSGNYYTASLMRELMFRNWANLLTGFYIFRPDEPMDGGYEPLITEYSSNSPPGAPRPRYGLGAYYPSAGFYWPFGGNVDAHGFVTNAVGVDVDPTYGLANPVGGGGADQRHIAYSINMLSTNAAPEWAGELFYKSISGSGTNTISGTGNSAASQIMTAADWISGAPSFVTAMNGISGLMTNEGAHNTNISPNPSVWRPLAFNGSQFGTVGSATTGGSATGGYVTDGAGHIYKDTMAYSGRPTHYFDFSKASWEPIPDNHTKNNLFLQLGNWKAQEYAWHARALGVTIYTVGYGTLVTDAEQAFLAQLANATNTTAGGGSNMPFNASQPIGQQFYAATPDQISNDFYQVGQAINAALTQ